MGTVPTCMAAVALMLLAACAASTAPPILDDEGYFKTASGLRYLELKEGTGISPQAGQNVLVHYTGWLLNGRQFDSSLDRGQPFAFTLGAKQVIPGWDEGVATMKLGGKRKLIVPPKLGYGKEGAGRDIPPNATLVFEVELLAVR